MASENTITMPPAATPAESENKFTKDEEQGTIVQRPEKKSYKQWLLEDIDPKQATVPLAAFCFMTGFLDAIAFSAVFVWCGFQTGNFIQLSVAIAHLFEGPAGPKSFNISDQQALCSLLAFNVGAFLCRWGDTFGPHKRAYTVINSFTATLFNMAAAICIWQSGEIGIAESRVTPAWTKPLSFAAIGFMSASLGMQGFQGKRLNTQFATCVVLTTVWVELMTDPGLFKLRQKVISRDHKVIAAFSLFLGAFIARAILYKIGPAGCLGIATGIRLLITISWFFVPAKPEKKNAN